MTLVQLSPATDEAADRHPGPNQWFKDHLDAVIDAELLRSCPEADAATVPSGPRR
ncbi:hypothetical protein SUDANB176_06027 [Streptomyces sp. enrichment culture]|uniref:hypothetical protein n=1 Tax=Streptomyces sp. enrichment culture TaxID=1795815 RepID=UPI003F561B7D